jgi:hypothetical protein
MDTCKCRGGSLTGTNWVRVVAERAFLCTVTDIWEGWIAEKNDVWCLAEDIKRPHCCPSINYQNNLKLQ